MQGIEVLNKTPVMVRPEWWGIGVLVSIVLLCVFLYLTIICFDNYYDLLGILCFVITVICFVSALICGDIEVENTDGKYRYEVTIDDDVSIQEVYKHYNVIEQDGKKWILEDKESAE